MKFLKRCCLSLLLLGILACMSVIVLGYVKYRNALDKTSLKAKIAEIQSSETYVTYEDISSQLLQATLSIEDRRFFEHNGIDYLSTTRAVLSNLLPNKAKSGGSTITQQLAKNLYFNFDHNIIKKISEIFMARAIEDAYSKETIIEIYVNVINYGDNYIGIHAACAGYFQKTPKNVTLQEASLLAGIPQSPANYQLSDHYQQAIQRQKYVLKAMLRDKSITEKSAKAALIK